MNGAIIVGGGAAGLLAAGALTAQGVPVVLFEKNRQLGRKVRITGKGRCNVTNHCTPQEVAAAAQGGKFLYTALYAFPTEEVMDFF